MVMVQIDAVNKARDAMMPAVTREEERAGAPALLLQLRGIGPEFASVLYSEGFYRHFANRRQVAAYAGLAPSPWRSGTIERDQAVSKAGNKRLRTTMIQAAWLWLRHQPASELSQWFNQRVQDSGGRVRRVMIVAMARKLLIALWRFATAGVVPKGATLKAA